MAADEAKPAHPHGNRELCSPGISLYKEALRAGRIARSDLAAAPCLLEMALVHPDPDDRAWLRPVPASAALAHLLQPITREIDERIRLTTALSGALAPLATITNEDPNLAITVLEGRPLIMSALQEASARATEEVLTAQPGGNRLEHHIQQAIGNGRAAIAGGASLRHLYQHPVRYSPRVREYLARMPGDRLQVRTIEQTVDRLIIFDRTVAYAQAAPREDVALEIRHPALVRYLTRVYEVLWAQATPYSEQLPAPAPGAPVTAVQQSIARLLLEGRVDDEVARELGISVRTCRSHISKLMQTVDAHSRTQLGARLVRSGIVEPDGTPPNRTHARRPVS
ncbi:LuxR C-terminal-related transcriptional regulator [Streptomyces sp. NE06-03E]|uniref:DNA-binding response regulator n=1 Tax=Streptomyces sp. gb1(2016) TaxID=1828321 RepID=A0A652LE84_9ACTN|nr:MULTISPECIES: LuxR C-terminal-related transcriptional regulator [unclassified Streptomyces]MDX3057317.1 LuxR C-terminal-related transcriptional regulator [Streptomyces sp. NE06-03E]RPK39898.1 Bacterial regulatory protein, LuxR family [Streptomyces sp. ADI93-02]TXS34077.1 DNA-binding response regulator [Streptomyces sp. gb1(2016)]